MAGNDITPSAPRAIDANGFDPADFDWLPIARVKRHDGWEPHRQRAFVEALADTGSVTEAARQTGMSVQSCYRLRRAPDAAGFARAWDAAVAEAGRRLIDIAMDRAVNGVEQPRFDKHGQVIHVGRRHSDRLLMFLLRAHHPERFGPAGDRAATARPADGTVAGPPVAQAIAALEPQVPAEPHRLMHPVDLANLLANMGREDEREAAAVDKPARASLSSLSESRDAVPARSPGGEFPATVARPGR